MHQTKASAAAATIVLLMSWACSSPEPVADPAREESARAETAAAELRREHNEEAAGLEKRMVDLDLRWSEMEGKLANTSAKAAAGLRTEVKEDVENAKKAIADLKTTTPENWWERHERAMQSAVQDVEADVRRLARTKEAAARTDDPNLSAGAAPFASRRDRFVASVRAKVDAMQEQLGTVRATGARKTEVDDTRERLDKIKGDVDRLANASADDWWDITSKRVSEYIDRVEESIKRLDDNKS